MTEPFYQDNDVTIFNKDCRSMDELADESVQCVVTSPPFWGLRKYSGEQDLMWGDNHCEHEWGASMVRPAHPDRSTGDHDQNGSGIFVDRIARGEQPAKAARGQAVDFGGFCYLCGAWKGAFGLEPSPEMYVQHTIEILREIRRVLRSDGVVFWNIGDSYVGSTSQHKGNDSQGHNSVIAKGTYATVPDTGRKERVNNLVSNGLKPKDLCLIPFRIAISAQEDGWWVRSVIIWNKPNPMPESVTDRPTESHEYVLMLTKSKRYYWDAEAVREPINPNNTGKVAVRPSGDSRTRDKEHWGVPHERDMVIREYEEIKGRNIRSVWTFATQPYPEAHFAVFPEKLPEMCIKAATPEVGCCGECGAPWVRMLEGGFTDHNGESETEYPVGTTANRLARLRQAAREQGGEYQNAKETLGWQPTCKCNADKVPSLCLDPFMGSGTTLWVAKRLGRRAVGYDLSEEYCRLAVERNRQQALL